MTQASKPEILAIIGLGNPGQGYYHNRHSIGFRVVEALANREGGVWREREEMSLAEVTVYGKKLLLIKPLTFMNTSGCVIPFLSKRGIKPENILVVHDELEQPFGKISIREGGSARGHNGLRSIISACGEHFFRMRFGIGRPELKEQVPSYVLQNFSESSEDVECLIEDAVTMLLEYIRR